MDRPTLYCKPKGATSFEEEFLVEALSQMGNPLERLCSHIYEFIDVSLIEVSNNWVHLIFYEYFKYETA